LLLFLVASISGASFQARPKVWERGGERLTLFGASGGMWTQVREMINEVIMSGKGVIHVDEGVGPNNQN